MSVRQVLPPVIRAQPVQTLWEVLPAYVTPAIPATEYSVQVRYGVYTAHVPVNLPVHVPINLPVHIPVDLFVYVPVNLPVPV